MKSSNEYMYTKDSKFLQISYAQYMALREQSEEIDRMEKVKAAVLSDLLKFDADHKDVGASIDMLEKAVGATPKPPKAVPSPAPVAPEPVEEVPVAEPEPVEEAPASTKKKKEIVSDVDMSKVPAIKKDIVQHFKKLDESGTLFDVFKEYYTDLNLLCNGMLRVTMKDGICSLWNYDEWEEFAFVDIFKKQLRVSINPAYAEDVKSLPQGEVPRLLATKHKLICVLIDDVNDVMMDVLIKAFKEVGAKS